MRCKISPFHPRSTVYRPTRRCWLGAPGGVDVGCRGFQPADDNVPQNATWVREQSHHVDSRECLFEKAATQRDGMHTDSMCLERGLGKASVRVSLFYAQDEAGSVSAGWCGEGHAHADGETNLKKKKKTRQEGPGRSGREGYRTSWKSAE